MSNQQPGQPGSGTRVVRRLAAVFHADVVGFSRLMAIDEGGTHARLLQHRERLYDRLRAHDGRVVGTAGDAVLAIFDSVVDALASAVAIQEDLAEANAALRPEEKLEFRIGLNIGDIIIDGDDVFGNGVNVAARTEALADPGGIAVSASVKEQVGNTLPVTFEDRGLHSVKNIDRPLHVYAVFTGDRPSGVAAPRKLRRKIVVPLLGAGAACAIGVAAFLSGGFGALNQEALAPDVPDAAVEAALLKPTIAVLPFGNRNAAQDDYFGNGVTEDVIGSLGRFSNLLVLSWSAVAPYRAQDADITQMAADLGADYVVTGSIQRSGDMIRVNVQISDASNGVLIWSERYDEQFTDLLEVQDRLVRQVVSALAVRVTRVEETRVATTPTESMTAYDLVLRGRDLLKQIVRDANLEARDLFQRALEEDPGYADALVGIGQTRLNDLAYGWTFNPRQALDTAMSLAQQAIDLDQYNSGAHALMAVAQMYSGNLEDAERSIDRSLELNPNRAASHAERCTILMFAGRPAEALPASDLALALDPYPQGDQLNCSIASNLMLGRYEEVLQVFEDFPDRANEEPTSLAFRAGAHAMLGQEEEAERYRTEALARFPFLNPTGVSQLFRGEENQQVVLMALTRAGFE